MCRCSSRFGSAPSKLLPRQLTSSLTRSVSEGGPRSRVGLVGDQLPCRGNMPSVVRASRLHWGCAGGTPIPRNLTPPAAPLLPLRRRGRLPLELGNLIAQLGGALELQVGRGRQHLAVQLFQILF